MIIQTLKISLSIEENRKEIRLTFRNWPANTDLAQDFIELCTFCYAEQVPVLVRLFNECPRMEWKLLMRNTRDLSN